jgi:cobalt/nickel transport system ATP-binding protein
MSKVIFELKDVCFSYLGKFPALNSVSFDIEEGQRIAIIGANGCGKSTLLHLLDSLIFADRGVVKFKGRELKPSDLDDSFFSLEFRKSIGLVFQNPDVQLFSPTVKEDILFGPLQLGLGKKETGKAFDELVDILDLKNILERSPQQLSIGEKRKVAIASSLIINPQVLLLDEPTAGLDPLTTRHIIDLLAQANSAGKTIITSTHDLHIVEEVAEIVYVFGRDKTIAKRGLAGAILNDIELLSANNLVHIHAHRHKDRVHIHPHVHLDHHSQE